MIENGEKRKYMKDIKEEELTVTKSDWIWKIRERRNLDDSPFLAWVAIWAKVLINV